MEPDRPTALNGSTSELMHSNRQRCMEHHHRRNAAQRFYASDSLADTVSNGSDRTLSPPPSLGVSSDGALSNRNSFLKWFKRSPIAGERTQHQPSPQRIVSEVRIVRSAAPIAINRTPAADPHNRPASLPNADRINAIDDTPSIGSSSDSSLSLSSLSSRGSVYSTATNGFAFIPPEQYAPFGAGIQPDIRIAAGPVTDTYRQRLAEHQRAKTATRGHASRLSQKYNLLESDTASAADEQTLTRRSQPPSSAFGDRSLPAQTPSSGAEQRRPSVHRRTFSENSKVHRAGAYVHVKGKRKAPPPPLIVGVPAAIAADARSAPATLSPASTLGRRKRQAPAPPALASENQPHSMNPLMSRSMNGHVQSTDTLRLEDGQLRHTENVPATNVPSNRALPGDTDSRRALSPRPWYKRSSSHDSSIPFKREITLKTIDKRKPKPIAELPSPEVSKSPDAVHSRSPVSLFDGFFARVRTNKPSADGEKRRSAIPNISELDREAADIVRHQHEAQRLADDQAASGLHRNAALTDMPDMPPARKSTRELISRFEETKPIIRRTVNTKPLREHRDRYFADASAGNAAIPAKSEAAQCPSAPTSLPSFGTSSTSSSAGVSMAPASENRALSTPPPKPPRLAAVADAPVTTPAAPSGDDIATATTDATSMMQRIFSQSPSENNSKRPANTNDTRLEATAKNTPGTIAGAVAQATRTASVAIGTSTAAASAGSRPTEIPAASATWTCDHCTLSNYNWRVICEVCERMRPYARPEAIVGPDGELRPAPRFRYTEKRPVETSPEPANGTDKRTVETSPEPANGTDKRLIDSSAVLVTGAPKVFVAPLPARHDQPPNLSDIRAARLEKFAHIAEPVAEKTAINQRPPQPLPESAKPDRVALLVDRGSLEREKKRLRDIIRGMNAKALADKYPVYRAKSPIHAEPGEAASVRPAQSIDDVPMLTAVRSAERDQPLNRTETAWSSASSVRPAQSNTDVPKATAVRPSERVNPPNRTEFQSETVQNERASSARPAQSNTEADAQKPTLVQPSEPVAIPVGGGAIRKILQPKTIESPEDKIISDTTNYNTAINADRGKTMATKTAPSASRPDDNNSPAVPRRRPMHLLHLPSPITEFESVHDDELHSPNTRQRLVDEEINSIYAELRTLPANGLDKSNGPAMQRRATDTLALSKVFKNLERAICSGQDELASKLAKDLARMRVALTVTKQQPPSSDEEFANSVAEQKIPNESDGAVGGIDVRIDYNAGARALPIRNAPKDDWSCALCTLINDADRAECAACSGSRPTQNAPLATQVESVRLRVPPVSTSSNDLNRTSANRRSAELFNIVIPTTQSATPSPNITRTKYRGVDNYNPQAKKAALATSTANAQQRPAPAATTNIAYQSPFARTNDLLAALAAQKPAASAMKSVKITAVTLKSGENIPVVDDVLRLPAVEAPDEPAKRHYDQLLDLDQCRLVRNSERFECPVCLCRFEPGDGVVLRDCLHTFCRECLVQTVRYSDDARVRCPYSDVQYSCDSALQDREIRELLSREEYERYLAVSLNAAESRIENAFHCRTPGCRSWCIYEDNVNEFRCPICKLTNCLTCRVVHDGLNCKQYQDQMSNDIAGNEDARRTGKMLNDMIERGEAMKCPVCQVVLMKKWGCDWLKCSMCKTEICWVTRGIRWGPNGKGDTSAGCRCGVNGQKCHPKCTYCH